MKQLQEFFNGQLNKISSKKRTEDSLERQFSFKIKKKKSSPLYESGQSDTFSLNSGFVRKVLDILQNREEPDTSISVS